MIKINLKKILALREETGMAMNISIEKYACELAGEKYQEKDYFSRLNRSIAAEMVEPLPISRKKKEINYILTLLTACEEKRVFSFARGMSKWPNVEII